MVEDGAIRFRDEDFEAYIRDHVKGEDVTAAHGRLADMFLNSRKTDPEAAAHVTDHLSAAGLFHEQSDSSWLRAFRPASLTGCGASRFRPGAWTSQPALLPEPGTRRQPCAWPPEAATPPREPGPCCSWWNPGSTWLPATPTSTCSARTRFAKDRSQWLGPILMRLAAALSRDPERHAAARAELG